ncbi:amidohydrolase [Gryllotalpicola ginsengisoli]|uniref:amidohydrolase n=1 Tax=Gryllotalpicola ginsengisoli TaxID=444608 RepID=UPI0004849FFD|nr:amidohydrolase [Gryllotalpicola ginsengisoli]
MPGLTFTGARLLDGRLVDVTVTGPVISAVTPAGELDAPGEHIPLDGHLLIPGLWDRHVHFTQWALAARRVPLDGAQSAAEAAFILREWADAHPDGDVIGVGYHDGLWPDAPHVALLDDVAADRRVIAVNGDLHSVWLNSAALKAHGLHDHPTGVLREEDAFAVVRRLAGEPDEARLDEWAHRAGEEAAARGVVGIVDFEMSWNIPVWQRRFAAGFDELRVEASVYPAELERALELGLRSGQSLDESGLLTMGPLKVISDGSLGTRTAYCFDPYPGRTGADAHGLLTVPPDRLVPLLRRAHGAGLRAAVHAIGDHAASLALDAFAVTGAQGSIEHAQLLRPDDLGRFAELGLVASVQPEHALDDRDMAETHWPGRSDRAFPLRSLLDAGAVLALGSDAPVAPLDPWVAISAAVFRTRDDRPAWHPEQSITLAEAVAASTRSTIAVGRPADLVVLGSDPREADAAALRELPVAATMVAGRFSYDAIR